MSDATRAVIVCTCEETMPLDLDAVARACGRPPAAADQLCGRDMPRFLAEVAKGAPVTIACTQEAPLFEHAAEDSGVPLSFVNIRETGGWSTDAARAGPKSAALIAAARETPPPVAFVTLESAGVALVLGRDGVAVEAAERLADRLDITVLLTRAAEVTPPRVSAFPIRQGTVRLARGHLGAFTLTIDGFAAPLPSSRRSLTFGPARDGAESRCDIILDLSGRAALFPAPAVRPGYVRADPADPLAVERAIAAAGHLVGTFDKPRFVNFEATLCAHSRSGIVGCHRCLDLCPTAAIAPAGDTVAIDAAICAGCGACAAACPTGAAAYALPSAEALLGRLRTLMQGWRAAGGGGDAIILFHDAPHGEPLIDALARFGEGLPAHVIPVRVNEVTQVGPEAVAALLAYGAAGVAFLVRARPPHDIGGLRAVVETSAAVAGALGFGAGVVRLIETDDPDALRVQLDAGPIGTAAREPATFVPRGGKRGVLETAFRELHRAAPAPVDVVALPAGAPFGGVVLDTGRCTLCLACVAACPSGALGDNPARAMLRFTESVCVQCGLCEATCPEDAITLRPRLDFAAWNAPPRVLKEEDPFPCIACGAPFGTRSTVERVVARLEEKHWMFAGEHARRIDVVKMCESCRVTAVVNESFDPHATPRPPARTSDDYLAERAKARTDGQVP